MGRPNLHIVDILEHICEHAEPGSLVMMARTTRAFHESAIRVLWRDLPSLEPLIYCFPADAWTIIQRSKFVSLLVFLGNSLHEFTPIAVRAGQKLTRIVTPKDWTAVLKYAAYVRRFITTGPTYGFKLKLEAAVWDTMCWLRPTAVLFPQLRSLRWDVVRLPDKYLPSFLICAGTNLDRLELQDFSYYDETVRASLGILAEHCPGLREVLVPSFGPCTLTSEI
ncbi:uncharacterized protein TRAVEDRAFT_46632 [Trametes versicolor FP-101664 SS1]|uniref:uncharacterized protein n=1 Tax=Trametes versicolor (strain FP-101664) TaxID=717944 RepID=UPI000462260D|nr:uncharacterized protein TRAVEDRAFT_46632 [Trametes versicolor FP-101664 SS1]EIW59327.1 hypothetical protein TRAVEDRAFT_46632 [Trametes versicolor FP-101664 SS1]